MYSVSSLQVVGDGVGRVELNDDWFRANVDETVTSSSIEASSVIVGRMSVMFPVDLELADGRKEQVIVKRIVPDELEDREHNESFIESCRREVSFYGEEVHLQSQMFPKVFASFELQHQGKPAFLMVMEELRSLGYEHIKCCQELFRVEQALAGLAQLNTGERLQGCLEKFRAYQREPASMEDFDKARGGFWVASRRPEDELNKAAETWGQFLSSFEGVLFKDDPEKFQKLQDIGPKLAELAPKLQKVAREHSVATIHGDAKSWNIFHPVGAHAELRPVKLIDLQWKGLGHPLQDFVYFSTTSVSRKLLDDKHGELIMYFRGLICAHLDATRIDDIAFRRKMLCANKKEFARLADLLFLDYARVVLLGLWRGSNPAKVKEKAERVGISLVTASFEQMEYILDYVLKIIDSVE